MKPTKYIERSYQIAHDINCNAAQLNKKANLINGQYIKLASTTQEEFNKLINDEKALLSKLEQYDDKIYPQVSKEEYRAYKKELKRVLND